MLIENLFFITVIVHSMQHIIIGHDSRYHIVNNSLYSLKTRRLAFDTIFAHIIIMVKIVNIDYPEFLQKIGLKIQFFNPKQNRKYPLAS